MQETQETQVQSLEDSLEKGMTTLSSSLPGKSHERRSLAGYSSCSHKESDTTENECSISKFVATLVAQTVKNLFARHKTWVQPLGRDGTLEKSMANYSNTLTWKIPWAEEPRGLQSIGLQRVEHN